MAVATNVNKNCVVQYKTGKVVDAVRASASLIQIFTYQQHPDHPGDAIVDVCYGGNLPAGIAKEFGEYVLANNVSQLVSLRACILN